MKTRLIVQKLKIVLLVALNSCIFAEQNGREDAMTACTVAELWTLTQTDLTKHCSEKNVFFLIQLFMWACPYIPINYPWYEHANSGRKRCYLAVAANEWHNRVIRNFVVRGCLVPCFVFLGGECLRIQTGNHGNTLYGVHITLKQWITRNNILHNKLGFTKSGHIYKSLLNRCCMQAGSVSNV